LLYAFEIFSRYFIVLYDITQFGAISLSHNCTEKILSY